MKRFKRQRLIFVLASIEIVTSIAVWLVYRDRNVAMEYMTAPVEIGSLQNVVQATGIVQTLVTVQVGSQISGQILEIDADFNSVVKRGQLLAKIDPRSLNAQLENAEAALEGARARLTSADAGLRTAAAGLANARASRESAKVSFDNTATYLKRAADLNARGLISRNDFDLANADSDTARSVMNRQMRRLRRL